jgi:hypothetical protein
VAALDESEQVQLVPHVQSSHVQFGLSQRDCVDSVVSALVMLPSYVVTSADLARDRFGSA